MASSTKPFLLYTAGTPNGFPISIFLEELKALYPNIDYDVDAINIITNRQKEPWFIALNPNGRIPALVDRSRDNFVVFETSAILLYLAQHYDTEKKFHFDAQSSPNDFSEMMQWMFFAHGGIGPMQGQGDSNPVLVSVVRSCNHSSHHFLRYAPEDIPYAKKRYGDETKRLYGVLEIRLANRDWLAGPGRGKYTIADVKTFPWVRSHKFAGIETMDEFPNVKAWLERNTERAGVQAGLLVPAPKK
ncbi:glutathione S-transferase [Mycena sp. CBHHK59/15]|nr:glutathione S-transferase [Mycena sp. CBHHK59/15]